MNSVPSFPYSSSADATAPTSDATVRLAVGWASLMALAFGLPLNAGLAWLIHRHTPDELRAYSKVLLPTCLMDMAMLVASHVAQPVIFTYGGSYIVYLVGYVEHWPNPWKNVVFMVWNVIFFSSFVAVIAQFTTRYLILNLNRSVSLRRYAGMFGVVFAVVLTASAAYELLGYPTPIDSQTMLANPWIAGLLSLAPTNGGGLRGGGGGAELALCLDATSVLFKLVFVYYCLLNFSCMGVIVTLGYRMWHYVNKNLKGSTALHAAKVHSLNQQLTLTLILQAILPALTFLPVTFDVVVALFSPTETSATLMAVQMFLSVPMYWAAALNPLVTLSTIRAYRHRVIRLAKRYVFCCLTGSSGGGGDSAGDNTTAIPLAHISAIHTRRFTSSFASPTIGGSGVVGGGSRKPSTVVVHWRTAELPKF